MSTHIKCQNCPDIKYRQCPAPSVILNGLLYCENNKGAQTGCEKCGVNLVFGHFAYDYNSGEFWCEDCLRILHENLMEGEKL